MNTQWQFNRKKHGSLYDRGMADSYYHRNRDPHFGGPLGCGFDRTEVTDAESVSEYNAGYDFNEEYGDKKDWGHN